ncbi:Eco57I restriction-modification methylase domain-containing protein [Agromyces silvae]|uniref:Eco57I restriction-modification methylase domain-containing protein n=1 Tax=Agromyces silvae TaxID=3388266 RepID=UPI00280C0F24|nr:DNA methyltransferase [Agromyces protaetiae]
MSGELQAIKVVGGVLPAALMQRIQANELSDPASLSSSSYHLVGNEKPRDAAARAWSYLRGAWSAWREAAATDATAAGTGRARDRWLLVLLNELGYGRLPAATAVTIEGTEYPISHRWAHVPIHLLGPGADLDRRNANIAGAARAPQAMLQEYLNRTDDDLWGILSNGVRLRLLRDSTAFAGSAYVEFDLEAIFDGELYAEFQMLWLLCHQSRVEKRGGTEAGPADCWLEAWRSEAAEAGTRALEDLRRGVEEAIKALGTGFLANPKNDWLRAALHRGILSDREYHKALLRLIYRLLFAFVAEDRGALLDPAAPAEARERYQQYFSTVRLRKLSRLRSGGVHPDLWRSLRMVLAALGGNGMPQLGVPALGGLFDPDRRAPDIEDAPNRDLLLGAELTNQALLTAMRHLAWIKLRNERTQPIDYRHLGAEELGGVYESLLELVPRVDLDTQEFRLEHLSGNERKTTGSYYTPPALVSALLDSALDPVLDDAVTSGTTAEEKERNLLSVTVCDPASGSGGFLVAAARRIARRLAQVRSGEDEPTSETVQHALHDVVARCIYGVDMNDLAAELAKVSLWLEALEPGKPLGFLDARIRIGNSLFGTTPALLRAGVPTDAFKEIEGDDKKVAAGVRKRNGIELKGQGLLGGFSDPELAKTYAAARGRLTAPTDDLASIRSRGAEWDALMASPERRVLQLRADAWAAAFVWPLVMDAPPPPTTAVVDDLATTEGARQHAVTAAHVEALSREYQFFHWHLEFPEIFGELEGQDAGPDGWAGGFSCMLGNPPWEQIELREKEFFASRDEEIARATGSKRKALIARLAETDPILDREYRTEKRRIDGLRKFTANGRYPLTGRGRVNMYAVFAELFRTLTTPFGCSGVIVQTGIATDDNTQYFFKDIVRSSSLAALYDFDNTKKLFGAVDSRTKFCILAMGGRDRSIDRAQFAFFLNNPQSIGVARFALSSEEILLLNPNTGTAPVFRTRHDAELALAIYRRAPIWINRNDLEHGNPWGVSLIQGLFNMTSDSELFRTRDDLASDGWVLVGNVFHRGNERMLPLYEGKMVHHYDHRWATMDGEDIRGVTDDEKASPEFESLPRYWVAEREVQKQAGQVGPWFGFRDTTNATNERTIVSSMWPVSAVGNNLPIVTAGPDGWMLVPLLSSYVFDFVARLKVGGSHVNFFIANQLPVLSPHSFQATVHWAGQSMGEWLRPRLAELVYTSWAMADWGRVLDDGVAPFVWNTRRRELMRAEIEAAFFHLYGTSRDELEYMMDSFWSVKRSDEAEFGEYRTKRLVLENYDAIQRCIDEGTIFVSSLDPAPGFGPRHPEKESA